ncbi:cystatin-like [Leptodactylus fuscus]|uniref:cystatin-like n=1 Tax=Leptodactylus fuscus TaxID=238119 RepID=UPI003F4F3CE1
MDNAPAHPPALEEDLKIRNCKHQNSRRETTEMAFLWKICFAVILALYSQVHAQNKRAGGTGALGGWRDADENSELAQKALQVAKDEYNRAMNGGYITEFTKVIRLRKQVVAGAKYSIEVEALVSDCYEKDPATEECQNQEKTKKRCNFQVFLVPWQNRNELLNSYCR